MFASSWIAWFAYEKAAPQGSGFEIGGPDQDRTDDLRNAIAALFQLSYEPIKLPKSCTIKVSPLKARTFSD
jgi:hypothetical protein